MIVQGPIDKLYAHVPQAKHVADHLPELILGLGMACVARDYSPSLPKALLTGGLTSTAAIALRELTRREPEPLPPAPPPPQRPALPPPESPSTSARQAIVEGMADLQRKAAEAFAHGRTQDAETHLAKMWEMLQPFAEEPWFERAWNELKAPAQEAAMTQASMLRQEAQRLDETMSGSKLDEVADLFAKVEGLRNGMLDTAFNQKLARVRELVQNLQQMAEMFQESRKVSRTPEEQARLEAADQALAVLLASSGKTARDVVDDGACLFAACADQAGGDWTAADLRAAAVGWLRRNQDEWSWMLDPDGDETAEQYCVRMAGPKEFGDQLEIRAISEALQMNVQTYAPQGAVTAGSLVECTSLMPEDGHFDRTAEILLHGARVHYLIVEDQSA